MAAVVDLELGLDAQLAHARRQPPDALRRVAEFTTAERHRADIERRHARAQFDQAHPVLVGHVEPDTGRELDEDGGRGLDQFDGALRDGEVSGRQALRIAHVNVHDRCARLVGAGRRGGDFLGSRRQVRIVVLGRDRTGQRGREDGRSCGHVVLPLRGRAAAAAFVLVRP